MKKTIRLYTNEHHLKDLDDDNMYKISFFKDKSEYYNIEVTLEIKTEEEDHHDKESNNTRSE